MWPKIPVSKIVQCAELNLDCMRQKLYNFYKTCRSLFAYTFLS